MSGLFHNIYLKVIFSASNLNGVAAMYLSFSLGSLLGSAIFALAALVGCFNKYRSLSGRYNAQNFLWMRLTSPALTAQILMAAAGLNALIAFYNIFMQAEHASYYMLLSLAWTFGVLGDDALRRNDKTNFAEQFTQKIRHLWMRIFLYTTRNPIFYYLVLNIFFSSAIFISPAGEQTQTLFILNMICVAASLAGVIYSLYQAKRMLKGEITAFETNNGVSNICMTIVNVTMAVMAALQGIPLLVFSQILFCIANFLIYFETRNALEKENI